MESHPKEPYMAPEAVVLEVRSEGIVCASGGNYNGFGNEQQW